MIVFELPPIARRGVDEFLEFFCSPLFSANKSSVEMILLGNEEDLNSLLELLEESKKVTVEEDCILTPFGTLRLVFSNKAESICAIDALRLAKL